MNQTSSPAASSWLLSAVQITVAAALVVAIFVSLNAPNPTVDGSGSMQGAAQTQNSESAIAYAHFQTDGSQPTISQCKFDESWSAPQTNVTPLGATPEVLRWGSNVEENGLGVTAPLSIQPTQIQPTQIQQPQTRSVLIQPPEPRVAQLAPEFTQGYVASPHYVSAEANDIPASEPGGWGSLTPEEVEMIERQRSGDVGLEDIEELPGTFQSDEFDSSAWKDPVSESVIEPTIPTIMIEPSVDALVIEGTVSEVETAVEPEAGEELSNEDFLEIMAESAESKELAIEPLAGEKSILEDLTIEKPLTEEPVMEELMTEPSVDELLETTTPLSDSVGEASIEPSDSSEDYNDDFIPLTDLPSTKPAATPQEIERAELELAPLPKFQSKSKLDEQSIVGKFKTPLEIKELPNFSGKLKAKSAKPKKRSNSSPTWWAQQIHQPQLTGRQQLVTTLDEVIFMALRAAPQIQILNTQPQIQQAALSEVTADFDWSTFVNSTWNNTNDPIGSTLTAGGTANEFIQKEWVFESGLRKRLKSGGDLSIGQTFGTVENNSTFLNPPDQGNSQLLLDYRQPLLRGAGPSFNSSQIALADLDLQSISSESLAELQAYLVDVVAAYWNIYFQRAVLVQNRQSVELAQELLRQLKSRKGIDVRNDQLLRAEAAVAARRSAAIRAEYDLINAQDTLINLVMGANSETVDQIELLPEPMMLPMGFRVESEQLVQAAIRNRPEVRAAIMQIRSSAIRKQVAANQLLPRLDAVVSSYVSGLRGNKSYSGAFGDQFSTGEPSYTVGFEFEVPIGNRAAKSRLKRSQYEAQVFHREFEKQVGDVVLDTRIAGREIERLNRENENNFKALQKAAQELDLIQQRQQLNLDDRKTGSLYIEDLLASQARLTAAEARLAQSQTSQAIALIDLKRATGELLRSGGEVHQPVPYEAVSFEEMGYAPEMTTMPAETLGTPQGFDYPVSTGPQGTNPQSISTPNQFGFPAGNGLPNVPATPQPVFQNNVQAGPAAEFGSFGYPN